MENIESDVDDDPPPIKKILLHSEIAENPASTTQQNEIQKIKQAHNQQVSKLKKKLKLSQQKARRLKTKVKSLKSVIIQLKERKLISSSCEEMLTRNFSGVPIALLKRMTSKAGKGCKYLPELKSFALMRQFYSTKAYNFVRKTFNLALPHPAQIRKWYTKVPADPGFTQPAFNALEALKAKESGEKLICSLMIDEMAIRKHITYDGKTFRGYVDLGTDAEIDDSSPLAKDALVFMVVGVNKTWKVPAGYFFIYGLSGEERPNLVTVCIKKLHDIGVDVISLICDGPSWHLAMLRTLGACMTPPNLKPYFIHPSDKGKKIYVLLDICHMLKLVRNTLGDGGILVDKDGKKVCWQYIIALQQLQEKEGLRLGNKFNLAHIRWWQQKMKVNLAAQTFSASVADANDYIMGLKNTSGDLMYTTRFKTGFIGFMVAIESMKGIFAELVERKEAPMKYILTYKFSQDHLELFFGAIRSSGGFNNNPTAQQFTAAYKRLKVQIA